MPGLWIPALLYEPDELRGKVPVMLNVNGHEGVGKAVAYKQMRCINQAKRGMIALNLEWFGMGQLKGNGFQHGLINALDLCGAGGVAVHYLAMERGIDILLAHEHADPERVGVTGLSGGGWQTIFFSPLETRVTFACPVAGYSSFHTRVRVLADLGDSEQTPCDLGTVVDYTHLTAMLAPHPALLTFNAKDDCCFAAGTALPPLLEAAEPVYRLYNAQGRLHTHINTDPGTHNYLLDNREALYQALAEAWSRPDTSYSPKEIPSDNEVKTFDALKVGLPDENLDLQKLALSLAKDLPRGAELPGEKAQVADWQQARRLKLRALVKSFEGGATVSRVAEETRAGITASWWTLRVGKTWTVPAVRLEPAEPKATMPTVLLLADGGRKQKAAIERACALVADGRRVVAVDPFYFGESRPAERDNLWPLLVATVGERPLGVQVGEVLMAAKAFRPSEGSAPVSVVAVGPARA